MAHASCGWLGVMGAMSPNGRPDSTAPFLQIADLQSAPLSPIKSTFFPTFKLVSTPDPFADWSDLAPPPRISFQQAFEALKKNAEDERKNRHKDSDEGPYPFCSMDKSTRAPADPWPTPAEVRDRRRYSPLADFKFASKKIEYGEHSYKDSLVHGMDLVNTWAARHPAISSPNINSRPTLTAAEFPDASSSRQVHFAPYPFCVSTRFYDPGSLSDLDPPPPNLARHLKGLLNSSIDGPLKPAIKLPTNMPATEMAKMQHQQHPRSAKNDVIFSPRASSSDHQERLPFRHAARSSPADEHGWQMVCYKRNKRLLYRSQEPLRTRQASRVSDSASPHKRNIPAFLQGRCFNCLATDHFRSQCRDPPRCWFCWRYRHTSRQCEKKLMASRRHHLDGASRNTVQTQDPEQNNSVNHRQRLDNTHVVVETNVQSQKNRVRFQQFHWRRGREDGDEDAPLPVHSEPAWDRLVTPGSQAFSASIDEDFRAHHNNQRSRRDECPSKWRRRDVEDDTIFRGGEYRGPEEQFRGKLIFSPHANKGKVPANKGRSPTKYGYHYRRSDNNFVDRQMNLDWLDGEEKHALEMLWAEKGMQVTTEAGKKSGPDVYDAQGAASVLDNLMVDVCGKESYNNELNGKGEAELSNKCKQTSQLCLDEDLFSAIQDIIRNLFLKWISDIAVKVVHKILSEPSLGNKTASNTAPSEQTQGVDVMANANCERAEINTSIPFAVEMQNEASLTENNQVGRSSKQLPRENILPDADTGTVQNQSLGQHGETKPSSSEAPVVSIPTMQEVQRDRSESISVQASTQEQPVVPGSVDAPAIPISALADKDKPASIEFNKVTAFVQQISAPCSSILHSAPPVVVPKNKHVLAGQKHSKKSSVRLQNKNFSNKSVLQMAQELIAKKWGLDDKGAAESIADTFKSPLSSRRIADAEKLIDEIMPKKTRKLTFEKKSVGA